MVDPTVDFSSIEFLGSDWNMCIPSRGLFYGEGVNRKESEIDCRVDFTCIEIPCRDGVHVFPCTE